MQNIAADSLRWRRSSSSALLGVAAIASLACASPTAYENWGERLNALPLTGGMLSDVSLVLAAPPIRCDPVAEPVSWLGVRLDDPENRVSFVFPGSPASKAGVVPGDMITRVGTADTVSSAEVMLALRSQAKSGERINLETSRGQLAIEPQPVRVQQCYWEVVGGAMNTSSQAFSVNPYGGSGAGASTSYQRYFRASCRVVGEYLAECSWNYQQ
jgi:hypothetical protein